jgi:hypothetical protein
MKKSANVEFRNRGGDFEVMTVTLGSLDERVEPHPDVVDLAVVDRDQERLVHPGSDPPSAK